MAQHQKPLIIAHRGASGSAPENTLAAVRKALEYGAPMIEIDIHQTADSQLVVIHDETIDRTTTGKGTVKNLTAAEIRQYSAGSWYDAAFEAERVPLLSEVLDLVRDKAILLIEIKSTPHRYPALGQAMVDMIRSKNMLTGVMVQAFDNGFVEQIHRLAPEIKLGKLLVSDSRFHPFYFDEQVTFGSIRDFTYTTAINPNHKFATRRFVRMVHSMGQKVYCWTVNTERDYQRLVNKGVDGIITNYPERFIR